MGTRKTLFKVRRLAVTPDMRTYPRHQDLPSLRAVFGRPGLLGLVSTRNLDTACLHKLSGVLDYGPSRDSQRFADFLMSQHEFSLGFSLLPMEPNEQSSSGTEFL